MSENVIEYDHYRDIKDKSQLGTLADQIIDCINKAFGHVMPENEINSAVTGSLIVVAKTKDNPVVGFSTIHRKTGEELSKYGVPGLAPDADGFYLGAATLDPDFEKRGIYRELTRQRFAEVLQAKVSLVVTATQNWRVEKGHRAIMDELVQTGQLKSFDLERHLKPGFFGRRLSAKHLPAENTAFDILNQEAGDAFVFQYTLQYPDKTEKED